MLILCRALIEATLKKAISKNYHHAVGYLETLDLISPLITDWHDVTEHTLYMIQLRKTHALKKSFWSRY